MGTAAAIEMSELVKRYGRHQALAGLTLVVPRGGVYGLLGPNGAGKTTAVRVLATLAQPDGGHARVLGRDVVDDADAVRRHVSLTGQNASVDADLTGTENLVLLGRLLGLRRAGARRRAHQLVEAFDLADAADRQVRTYSGGMRRRLDLAASLVVAPELLFLDEPTTGLDPRSRLALWQLVRELVAAGTTVLLTTQYLDEADQLADRVGVIDHGRLVAEGTPGELKEAVGTGALRVRVRDPARRHEAARLLTAALDVEPEFADDPHALTASVTDTNQTPRALDALQQAAIAVSAFSLGQPSLDEVFLALTGQPATTTHQEQTG